MDQFDSKVAYHARLLYNPKETWNYTVDVWLEHGHYPQSTRFKRIDLVPGRLNPSGTMQHNTNFLKIAAYGQGAHSIGSC